MHATGSWRQFNQRIARSGVFAKRQIYFNSFERDKRRKSLLNDTIISFERIVNFHVIRCETTDNRVIFLRNLTLGKELLRELIYIFTQCKK